MDPGGERDRSVWASERVYRALIRLYPEEVRRRYAEEMVRYFGDLCREEWHTRGAKGMVLLWARTLPDLLFSVLKERGTMLLMRTYLPVAPATAARWGALSALLGGSLGIAFGLAYNLAIFVQLDLFSSGWVHVSVLNVLIFATLLSILGMFGLYGTLVARSGRPDALALSGATLAAVSAVSFLELFANNAAVMHSLLRWEMHRTMLLQQIGMCAYALGLLLLGASAFRARLFGRLRALPLVVALLILLNMSGMEYLAEFSGAVPFFGAVLLGWVMLEYHPTERAAAAGGAPRSVSEVGNHQSTSGERATTVPHRSQRPWLVLTALKERSALLARKHASYLSMDPRRAKRAAARAMVAVVLVSVAVVMASLGQTPTYEASAQVWVDQKQRDRSTNLAGSGEEILTDPQGLHALIQTMTHATGSSPVAQEAIRRLGIEMTPAELLDNLTIEQIENTSFIVLTYEDTDPVRATKIVNTVGEVSSELISERSAAGSNLTATVYEKAIVPESPVSPKPLRNGLLTLVMGLVLCVGTALALPGVAASLAGKLGRPAVPQGVGQAGLPFAPGQDGPIGDLRIYTINASGGDKFQLTHNDVDQEWPAYSPNGKRIAYTPIEGAGGIYSIKVGGGTRD